jgi:serine/threonine protein kinase
MHTENRCPACNAELAANAPRGLCPACLLKGGLGTRTQTAGGGSNPREEADFVPPTPAELAPRFPELEVLELVGRGGMGVVYKARQKRLDRLVALKILSPKIGQDPAFAERFTREARAMGMLNHPHIVAVYDSGQTGGEGLPQSPLPPGGGQGEGASLPSTSGAGGEGGLYYFLMEFVDGVNVRRLLDTGTLAPEEALAIVPQICDALQYAHDHGVVHRDIKPENVLLDKEGRVKIADFGIAKLVGREAKGLTLTGAGQIVGTPQYMAPEQIEHSLQVDHRADIYSLGVVFYQMLTGELPIGRFAPPSKKVQIDVRLDEVVLRALEKEPNLRYQQASEVKSEVETIVTTPGASHDVPTANKPAWQSPTMGWGHFIGYLFGCTFTSRLACNAANLSALGFLCVLGLLSDLPFPEARRLSGFYGLSGFFGLIGVAFLFEFAARRKAAAIAVVRWTARVLGTLLLLGMALFFIGEGIPSITSQPAPVRVEFVGFFLMALGMAIGWKWEGWAALCILAGEAEFHVAEWRPILQGALELPLLVGVLYGLCWWMQRFSAATGRSTSSARGKPATLRPVSSGGPSEVPRPSQEVMENARRQLHGPTVGLVVTSVLNWLAIFVLVLAVLPYGARKGVSPDIFLLAAAVLAVGSAVILVGALRMQRLESRGMARLAAVAAMLIGPGYLVGWPVGIWSLVVLARPEVVAAFRESERGLPQDGMRDWMKKTVWSVLVAIVLAIVVRTFVLESFRAATDAVAPDVPQGSYALVFKLARSYSPGDIVAYRSNGVAALARVVEAGPQDGRLLVQRRDGPPQPIAAADLIGRVILNTRAAHGGAAGA